MAGLGAPLSRRKSGGPERNAPLSFHAPLLLALAGLSAGAPRIVQAAEPAGVEQAPQGGPAINRPVLNRLTIDEALTLARQQDLHLAAGRNELVAADSGRRDAWGIRAPELRLSELDLKDGASARPEISLRLPPPRPGELRARRREALARKLEARAEVRSLELALESTIRRGYLAVKHLEAELEVVRRLAESRGTLARGVCGAVKQAHSTRLQCALAEVAHAQAVQEMLELELSWSESRAELLDRLGLPIGAPIELVTEPEQVAPLETSSDADAMIAAALRHRPELEAAAARREAAEAGRLEALSRSFPALSFVQVGVDTNLLEQQRPSWTLGAALELPIPGFNQAGLRSARGEIAVAQRVTQAETRDVAWQVRERRLEALQAFQVWQALISGPSSAARTAAGEVRSALSAGQIDMIEAARHEAGLIELERRELELRFRALEAALDLRDALGAAVDPGFPSGGGG